MGTSGCTRTRSTGCSPPQPALAWFSSGMWTEVKFYRKSFSYISVADPGCLSRILIFTHPGYINSNKRDGRNLCLNCWRNKYGPIFKELQNFLCPKLSLSFQKYGFGIRDPRFGIRKKPIPNPGSRGQKCTGSRIRIRNTAYTSGFLPRCAHSSF